MPAELEEPITLGLPWFQDELTLCPGDVDRYEVRLAGPVEVGLNLVSDASRGSMSMKDLSRGVADPRCVQF